MVCGGGAWPNCRTPSIASVLIRLQDCRNPTNNDRVLKLLFKLLNIDSYRSFLLVIGQKLRKSNALSTII